MTDVTTTPAATTRIPFTPDAPVLIHLGGALGVKEGHVVVDDGGAKIEVRYNTAKGEKTRSVKWNTITARMEEDVDAPAVDDVPVVDVAADVVDDGGALVVNMDGGEPTADADEDSAPVQLVAAAADGTEVVIAETQHVDAAPVVDETPAVEAPADDQPHVVTLLSGQNKQKQLAADVFGPGTDNGATWDGKSKLTVTDATRAAAALDAELEAVPSLKATVKAVRGKVTGQGPAPAAAASTGPKVSDLQRMAQDMVLQFGPTAILDNGLPALDSTWTTPQGDEMPLSADELAELGHQARVQAIRVLKLFKRPIPA